MLFRLIAMLLALAPALAAAQESVAAVPYRIDYGGWFTVSATVNGKGPYDFIIDTGATQSLVFENLRAELAFPPSGGPPQEVLGLLSSGKFPTFTVGDIGVGNAGVGDLVTVVLPDWNVAGRAPHGVLGLDFLQQYASVFDARTLTVSFYPHGASPAATKKWKAAAMEPQTFGKQEDLLNGGVLYVVKAKLNSRPVSLLFDLGASGTIINRPALGSITRQQVGFSFRPSGANLAGRIRDALDTQSEAKVAVISRFESGNFTWYKQVVLVQDAAILEDLGVHAVPFGLFGSDLLRDRSFMMDFSTGALLVGPKR